jgi:hypothetical protein
MHSFITKDKKVLDYHYQCSYKGLINFSVGDIFLGKIAKVGNREYTAVPFKGTPLPETVKGFGTRLRAAQYLIQVCMKGE